MGDEKIQAALSMFVQRLSEVEDVEAVLLFGSRARGDAKTESDIDVAVILKGNSAESDYWATRDKLVDVAYEVMMQTNEYISPVPIWSNQWTNPEEHTNPDLIGNIKNDGVKVKW